MERNQTIRANLRKWFPSWSPLLAILPLRALRPMKGPTMRRACLLLVLLCVPGVVHAQTGTPASQLVWDQAAPTLAAAQAYVYRAYADGATTASTLPATCTGASSPFVCRAPFPPFTPGSHTLALTAGNEAGESPRSAVLTFTFVLIPSVPANVRIE